MKLRYRWILCMVMTACNSTHVSFSYNKQIDFDAYKTFNFMAEEAALSSDSVNRKFLVDAASDQLRAKGLSKSDHPDLLVDIKFLVQHKQNESAVERPTSLNSPNVYLRSDGQYETRPYVEATVFIRLLDGNRKQMVWQGQNTDRISSQQNKSNTRRAVTQIFKKYPPVPGKN